MVQAKHFNVWVECYDRVKCDGLSASLSNTANLNSSKIFVLCKSTSYFKNKLLGGNSISTRFREISVTLIFDI